MLVLMHLSWLSPSVNAEAGCIHVVPAIDTSKHIIGLPSHHNHDPLQPQCEPICMTNHSETQSKKGLGNHAMEDGRHSKPE
jgi:hypothetical protein